MKKRIFIIILVVLSLGLLSSCKRGGVNMFYKYNNGSSYTAGAGEVEGSEIKEIVIDWISHEVTIGKSESSKITFKEDVDDVSLKYQMHYFIDGNVLRIKFAKSRVFLFHTFTNKKLEVLIPEGIEFNKVNINLVSSKLDVKGINSDEIDIESVSGSINLENIESKEFDLSNVSGRISIKNIKTNELDIETVSGKTTLEEVSSDDIDIKSVSGNINASLVTAKNLDIESVSGEVELLLNSDASFKLKFVSVSGDFDCEFSTTKQDKYYICGSDGINIDIETVSGDCEIKKK